MRLAEQDIERFRRDGALFPLRAFEPAEIAERLSRLEAIEKARAGRLPPSMNLKIHLLVPWLWDMVHDPRVLDPVEDLIGPDILCWGSSFFAKGGGDPRHAPWHQDATYWGLSAPEAVTAWIAFTPSSPENGCMRVVPGTHGRQFRHADTFDADNMLPGRERVLAEVADEEGVDVMLAPGEMSLHHLLLIHGSKPNRSGARRVGFAIRYIAGHLSQAGARRGSATLARGRDHGGFDLEARPEGEFHPAAVARHAAILRRTIRIVAAAAQAAQAGDPADAA